MIPKKISEQKFYPKGVKGKKLSTGKLYGGKFCPSLLKENC